MNAMSSGASGKCTVTKDVTKYTRAMIYEKIGKKVRSFTIERV